MDTKDLLKTALNSLYTHPELKEALEDSFEKNKMNLNILSPLSRLHQTIDNLTTGALIIAISAYFWSLLALTSIGLFGLRLSPYFVFYLIIFSSIFFFISLLIKGTISAAISFLEKGILKNFDISNSEEYLSNYNNNGEQLFRTATNDAYTSIPQDQLNLIKIDRKLIDLNFQANGLITELTNKRSNSKVFIQLAIVG